MNTEKNKDKSENSIGVVACAILLTAAPEQKAELTHRAAKGWRRGTLDAISSTMPPGRPARPDRPELLSPRQMPKRRGGGSDANRIKLLHALAHIELNAIDLAWDIIARFGGNMPREFIEDWVGVADDEARHFQLINERLGHLGASYGDFPAHDGLWQAAADTSDDLAARLAIVPMVLEARGLDVTPGLIARMKRLDDDDSAGILEVIYRDEIGHVAVGQKWFSRSCVDRGIDPAAEFQRIVRHRFRGRIKPPFNNAGRSAAGMVSAYYEPLAAIADKNQNS